MRQAVVIGYGSIGKYHARIAGNRYAQIAIVDISDGVRKQASADLPGATVAATLTDLDGAGWDWAATTAVIATWGPSHSELLEKLAALGVKRILCEKPLAHAVSMGAAMVRIARERGIALGVHHHLRYSGFVAGIAALADDLKIGDPQAVFVQGGAAGLVTNGIHHIDWISELFGAWPELVISTARGEPINPRSRDLRFYGGTAAWRYPGGREAAISFTNRSSVSLSIQIYYRDAVAKVSPNFEVDIRIRDHVSVERFPAVTRTGEATQTAFRGFVPGFRTLEEATEKLLDEIDSGNVSVFPAQSALLTLGACIGALASGTTGRVVQLPIDPDSDLGRTEWPIS